MDHTHGFRRGASYLRDTFSSGNEDVAVHGVSEKIVGVLGGGQLGRMLCQAASEMAIKVAVLNPSENCPASSLSYQHMVGSFDDSATVEEFAKRINIFRKYKLATAFNAPFGNPFARVYADR